MEPAGLSEWRFQRACERLWHAGLRAAKKFFSKLAYGNPSPPSAAWSRMRFLSWKSHRKGDVRGFATIEPPIAGKNGNWPSLPSRPLIAAGRRRLGVASKVVYSPVLEWRRCERIGGFSAVVFAVLRRVHPGDLEGAS